MGLAVNHVAMYLLIARDHERHLLPAATIAWFSNLALAYWLIPLYGATGVCYALLGSELVYFLFQLQLLIRLVPGASHKGGFGMSVKCSIIIPTYNTVDLTVRCIEQIQKNSPSDRYEIVVVNNHSTDGTAERIHQLFPGIAVIAIPQISDSRKPAMPEPARRRETIFYS